MLELGAENQAQVIPQNELIEFCETGVTMMESEIFHALELQLNPRNYEDQLRPAELMAVGAHMVKSMKPEMEHECAGHRVLVRLEVASKELLWPMPQLVSSLGDMISHPSRLKAHQSLTWWLF